MAEQNEEVGVKQVSARLPILLGDTRKYIYGADLFDALTHFTGADRLARLRLQRLTDKAVDLRFDRPDLSCPNLCGFFEFAQDGVKHLAWLRESEERVAERSALMDREAVDMAEFGTDSAEVIRDPRFSVGKSGLILVITLLERMFPDDAWNLAEMEAFSARADGSAIRVRLTRQIGKFLIASIDADGRPWGQVTLASTPYLEDVDT